MMQLTLVAALGLLPPILGGAAPQDDGRIFGVWATGSSVSQLPYLRGGQAVVQWSAVQAQADTFNFSALDAAVAAAVETLPASRNPLFSIQVNGNTHPRFLFTHVVSHKATGCCW